MARLNTPIDGMFRAGQISSKEWGRLSMNANGKGGKMKSKMAKFESKEKDEGTTKRKAIAGTTSRSINTNQSMTAKGVSTPPTRGGGVRGSSAHPSKSDQAKKFPMQGGGKTPRKTLSNQQPSSSNSSHTGKDSYYGGPNRRTEKPMRLQTPSMR